MSDWYQIENYYFTVQVNSHGAEMKRLFSKSWNKELLWLPHDEVTKKIWNRSAPILFPIVGKLKEDRYTFKDKSYQMTQHGFARDTEFRCVECSNHEIHFALEATQETFKQYPFCFELRVSYVLEDDKLFVNYSVKNTDRQDIYFSVGAHPAFSIKNPADYEIHFEKKERGFFQLENGLVNWKNLMGLPSQVMTLSKSLFAKDALIFKDMKSRYVDLVNTKFHQGIRMRGTNTPFFGIWAKENVPFVCLEPWYGVSDDMGHDQNLETKIGIQTLAPGGVFKFSYSLEHVFYSSEDS